MACSRCESRGKTWHGGDPECGFDEAGEFQRKNWNCATLNDLRHLVEPEGGIWHEDDRAGLIIGPEDADGPGEGGGPIYVVMRWYKNRGRTDEAYWWGGARFAPPRPITLAEAERVLEEHPRIAGVDEL